jgi:hypothetical protein
MMDAPGSWSAAKRAGATHYFTGRPCQRGHIEKRLASTGQCLGCLRDRMAVAYERDPEAARARSSAYRRANPEKVKQALREYGERNRPRRRERERQQYADPTGRRRSNEMQRRARKDRAIPSWFGELDAFALTEAVSLAKQRAAATGIEWEVDHAIPLRGKWASGLHCAANLQVMPAILNQVKGNRNVLTEVGEWVGRL